MRIFYAADHTPNAELSGSSLWHINLYLPLQSLGHELVSFDYDLRPHFHHLDPSHPPAAAFIEEHRPALERALLEQVSRAHAERPIDLFFSYFYSAVCRPQVIEEIKRLGIVTMNWYCNASYQFHLVEEIAPAYDHCLVPEKFRMGDYRRVGANPIYMQEAANPDFYGPRKLPVDVDVSFVGQRYGDRPDFIRHLARRGIPVHVFGTRWQEAHARQRRAPLRPLLSGLGLRRLAHPEGIAGPPLSDDELVAMYSRSKVSLGFSSCGDTHQSGERILQVRLRDFEAPMCAAFYMVEWMDELTEFFEPDREMVFYRDADDLADRVRYFLRRPAERERIRWAGRRRALAEHTWQHRFEAAFAAAGLPPRGREAA